jgi:hypothetical protein
MKALRFHFGGLRSEKNFWLKAELSKEKFLSEQRYFSSRSEAPGEK